jgi:hypothetical protein
MRPPVRPGSERRRLRRDSTILLVHRAVEFLAQALRAHRQLIEANPGYAGCARSLRAAVTRRDLKAAVLAGISLLLAFLAAADRLHRTGAQARPLSRT